MPEHEVEPSQLSSEHNADYLNHLEAVAFLLYSALSEHLEGPAACGSSRGVAAQARYERLINNNLMPEDLETMAPHMPATDKIPTLEQHLQTRDL